MLIIREFCHNRIIGPPIIVYIHNHPILSQDYWRFRGLTEKMALYPWSGKLKTIHIREFDENPHHYVHLRVHSAILPNRPDWSANEYYLGKYHFFHSIRERGRSGGVEYQIGRLAIGVRARECNCNRTMPNIGVNMFSSECQNPPVSSYILTKVIYNCLQIALPHIAYLVPGTACCSSKRACE